MQQQTFVKQAGEVNVNNDNRKSQNDNRSRAHLGRARGATEALKEDRQDVENNSDNDERETGACLEA